MMAKYKVKQTKATIQSKMTKIRIIVMTTLKGAPIKKATKAAPLSIISMSFEARVTSFPAPARA